MCITPCSTCSLNTFYSCLTCTSSLTLTGTLCLSSPTSYYQIATTCIIFIFIIPVLMRKRCLTVVRILDFVQMAAYFKIIRGYTAMRHIWLYLGMRGWGTWSEGWTLIDGDVTVPTWTVQQGVINKAIRVASTWGLFFIVSALLGLSRVALSDDSMTFQKYFVKNIGNCITYAFYFTLQDIAFIIAVPLLNPTFTSTLGIVAFVIALLFAILTILAIIWCFYLINFPKQGEKHYVYKYFFLFNADYDLFPTFQLLELPKNAKQIKKYSNIRILEMIKKIGYAFLLVNYLSSDIFSTNQASDELYQILGYLIFFEIVWLFILPYNIKKQPIQFAISLLAFGTTVFLLMGPWTISYELVHTVVVLFLFALAIISLIVEYCLDIYKIVPVDLYETGLKIILEDGRLLKEIAQRRKQQQEMMKKLMEIQLENQKLKKDAQEKQKQKQKISSQSKNSQQDLPQREDSEASIVNNIAKQKTQSIEQRKTQKVDDDKGSINSQDIAQLYKVDELKRRKVYQWNKQLPFTYSNKMQ